VVALVVRSAGGLRLTARPGRLDFARAPALFVFGAGTGACPYGWWFFHSRSGRGNPLWLPGFSAALAVCNWPGARVVSILRGPGAGCVRGQARGPAPTAVAFLFAKP